MKRKNVMAILLAGIVTVSMVAGCGSQPENTPGNNKVQGSTPVDDKTQGSGSTLEDDKTQDSTPEDGEAQGNMTEGDKAQENTPEGTSTGMDTIPSDVLMIARQGMFSSGGIVTEPVEGDYDPSTNWMDITRAEIGRAHV